MAVLFIVSCGSDNKESAEAVSDQGSANVQSTAAPVRERFELYDVDGKLRHWSEFAGKPLVLNFWATWCGPCRQEIPILKRLYDEYKSKGVEIVGISVDQYPSKVKPFVEMAKINYPVLYANGNLVNEFRLGGSIPFTIFFYPDGTESNRITGSRPFSTIKAEIEKISK